MTDKVNRFVQVEMEHQALAEPQFIIKSGDVYYLTLAVWAYDPNAQGMAPVQKEGALATKETFDRLYKDECNRREAVELPEMQVMYSAMIS